MKIFRKYLIGFAILFQVASSLTFSQENTFWCITNQIFSGENKLGLENCLPTDTSLNPCIFPTIRDSYIVDNTTQILYFSLLIVVVDSELYGVTEENIDTMMVDVNNFFNPWKISFCYTTEFIDSSQLSEYPKNTDSIINVVIQDWPTLGQSGDPIKIDYSVIINNNYQGGYSLAHELGHNFNLLHIFTATDYPANDTYLGCTWPCRDRVDYSLIQHDTTGDFISDTPPTPKNSNCAPQQGVDSCSNGNPSWTTNGYENLMGYSFCQNASFTLQQASKMHCQIMKNYYSNLVFYGMMHCNPLAINNTVNKKNKPLLEIIPNPASEKTTVYFNLEGQTTNGEIIITNMYGENISTFKVNGNMNKIDIDCSKLRNGIYFNTLYIERNIVCTKKMIVVK